MKTFTMAIGKWMISIDKKADVKIETHDSSLESIEDLTAMVHILKLCRQH